MSRSISPGFIALHGNRAEYLAQTVIDWLRLHPLDPLEEEVVLVQSNGMAEWFKMDMARQTGVCASVRVELPGRFIWRTYRQILGAGAVPRDSPLDKLPLTWRLMQVLPGLLALPEFAPVQGYLRPQEPDRWIQLAARLADLLDQYQNYRTNWLQLWMQGRHELIRADGTHEPLPADQRWQAMLWQAVVQTLDERQQATTRPALHRQVLDRLQGDEDFSDRVARRVVVYGMSHLPGSTLETLAALSQHCQVLLAVPNPCQHYWGDIMEGRELLKTQRRRQSARDGADLSVVALQDMHQHAHPLLAAWGRQGRDFIRQLDAHDDAAATQARFHLPRIDVFDDGQETADTPLLTRVQYRIRDLEPLGGDAPVWPLKATDTSICFHTAHSPVRELEVLHDQLLLWLDPASQPGQVAPLQPRDVVVMVPDIETMAPAIRAVFGQYQRHDRRYIPFDIADLSAQSSSLVVTALEWLLRVPAQRCRLSELADLLEVPALAARFGLTAELLPQLIRWMSGAGMCWGLNTPHRQQLGLASCGEQNSAWFALQRMLMGYATGPLADVPELQRWSATEPYAEIGGLDAELAGCLAHFIRVLLDWWAQARQPATPEVWVQRGRDLLQACFAPTDEPDQEAVAALDAALSAWSQACAQAGFGDDVDVAVFRHAWLEALEVPSLNQRFRAGGVTFCTLMPMRAIPFEVVCLLGMNDGDYPRRSLRSDFDLMALPGHLRPGDRSRRHDDRQLMLEALLSARRRLVVSWTGHSVRDNTEQPPSVLVSQLRDYIAAVWGPQAVAERTTAHPLQPFSRRYFEGGSLHTYAREWRSLHDGAGSSDNPNSSVAASTPSSDIGQPFPDVALTNTAEAELPAFVPDAAAPLTLQRLTQFLRNPVKVFFRERLGVVFQDAEQVAADDEPFEVQGLENYGLIRDQVQSWPPAPEAGGVAQALPAAIRSLRRRGVLPMQGLGDLKEAELLHTLHTMATDWAAAGQAHAVRRPRLAIEFEHGGVVLRDWLDPLYQASPAPGGDPAPSDPGTPCTWLKLEPSRLLDKKEGSPRPDKLLDVWVQSLAAAACGHVMHVQVVGQGGGITAETMDTATAQAQLQTLLEVWLQGMQSPLPLPLRTALALAGELKTGKPADLAKAYEGDEHSHTSLADVSDPCLARLYPDFDSLEADDRFRTLTEAVFLPLLDWVQTHVQAQPSASA